MTEKIFKYELKITDDQEIHIRGLREVISVLMIKDTLYLYAIVNTDAVKGSKKKIVKIAIFGTGNPMGFINRCDWKFRGSHKHYDGQFIWHVWTKGSIG